VNTLPVEPAYRLSAQADEQRWLVTDLWSEGAVGIVGGEPKCCKSFLALDLAVAVASGQPALRRFVVPDPGRVLLYAAEDAQHIVRARLEGICAAAGCEFAALDVQVITTPTLRLDLQRDRERLGRTIAAFKPRLLILDPFVRLHRIDENSSGEVAPILAYLRELQRRHALAVLVVHHAKKSSAHVRAGQALRGSSEFHAWGDSNLYLRRAQTGGLTLTIEHRAAASLPSLALELTAQGAALGLTVVEKLDTPVTPPSSLDERITRVLQEAARPVPPSELRQLCRVRHATLHERLRALTGSGLLLHETAGYRLVVPSS
jgi:RecA-family ATPase